MIIIKYTNKWYFSNKEYAVVWKKKMKEIMLNSSKSNSLAAFLFQTRLY